MSLQIILIVLVILYAWPHSFNDLDINLKMYIMWLQELVYVHKI